MKPKINEGKRVEPRHYSVSADFRHSLISEDRERRVAALEQEMLEALDSGVIEISEEELMGENFIEVLRTRLS